jgi:predicted transcriptional regulator
MVDSNEAVQEQVLQALVQSAAPLRALDLSRRFRLEKSSINKCLYGLLKRGKVHMDTTKTQGPPMWSALAAAVVSNYQEEEEKLLNLLKESDNGVTTFSLALALQKSSTLVHQMLYALLHSGMVEKIHHLPAAWKIRQMDTSRRFTLGATTRAPASNPRKRQASD